MKIPGNSEILPGMPHIRIRSLSTEQVQKLSFHLPRELAPVMQTEEDNFTVEKIETAFFQSGRSVKGDPFVEVLWFDRGQAVQDKSAQKITELVRAVSEAPSVCIVFTALAKNSYYENGAHF